MEIFEHLIKFDWELLSLQKQCISKLLNHENIHCGQPPLLFTLKQLGTCNQKDLATALHISSATITISLNRLEKAGLIKRTPDRHDLRFNQIILTDAGKKAADAAQDALDCMNVHKYQGFSDEELSQMLLFYQRILQNLNDYKHSLSETEESF